METFRNCLQKCELWARARASHLYAPVKNLEDKEDLMNMVLHLGRSIDCNINKSDVRDIYRVREKKDGQKNTPIVVEFSSTIVKTDILKKSKAHNTKNNKSKLRAKNLGFTKNEETPIFVSEQLTVKGSRLFFLARDLAKSKGYKFCWTSYGRVYVRMSENTPIILIKSEDQVQSLFQAAWLLFYLDDCIFAISLSSCKIIVESYFSDFMFILINFILNYTLLHITQTDETLQLLHKKQYNNKLAILVSISSTMNKPYQRNTLKFFIINKLFINITPHLLGKHEISLFQTLWWTSL